MYMLLRLKKVFFKTPWRSARRRKRSAEIPGAMKQRAAKLVWSAFDSSIGWLS